MTSTNNTKRQNTLKAMIRAGTKLNDFNVCLLSRYGSLDPEPWTLSERQEHMGLSDTYARASVAYADSKR